jgi:hypothetical protein
LRGEQIFLQTRNRLIGEQLFPPIDPLRRFRQHLDERTGPAAIVGLPVAVVAREEQIGIIEDLLLTDPETL